MKNKKIKKFLNKPFVKSLILGVVTLYIGAICSALGTWDFTNDTTILIKIILLLLGVAIYIGALAYYSVYEANMEKVTLLYESQNKAFENLMSGVMSSCKFCAEGANEIIHTIVNDSKVDLKLWDFDKACRYICDHVYKLLCELGNGDEFEVIYDRLVEDGKPEEWIYTNAYANKHKGKPSIYRKRRKFREDNYHDSELFKKGDSDFEIVIGADEIDKIFGHESKDKRTKNKNKYSQYIAIPVFCNDQKMVGLFEIVCLNETKLGNTEKKLTKKYYVILFLTHFCF